jgi:hypothetical protein
MPSEDITTRFKGVENSPPPSEAQQATVKIIRDAVLDLAQKIDSAELHPRYKATALTHLETAAMFAVKGVFQ